VIDNSLRLTWVADGKLGEHFWIEIDGDEESCDPQRLKQVIPELAGAAVSGDSRLTSGARPATIAAALGDAPALIADTRWQLFIFTRDAALHTRLANELRDSLAASRLG
jgi:hypothetical protein